MKYYVRITEVHYSIMEIEADSVDEAVLFVTDGDGDEVDNYYHNTTDISILENDAEYRQ
jgi:hypothetical protein